MPEAQLQFAWTAPALQSLPQAPQLATSVCRLGWLVSAPSQFASTLQVSFGPEGPTEPTHEITPAVHALVPAMQGLVAPAGGGVGTLQAPTESLGGWPLVLSMVPSQLSSTPLQVSVFGLTAPTQTIAPAWHCLVPNEHGKTLE